MTTQTTDPAREARADAPSDQPVDPSPPARDRVQFAVRTLFPLVTLLATFGVLVKHAAQPLSNFDTYFHLRFGHEFLGDWSLRHPGWVTSFASADWVPTQWLPQIVMAKTEDVFGLAGVAWLSGLLFVSLAAVLYLSGRRLADPVVVVPLVVLAVLGSTSGLSMRPQVISYICAALTLGAWHRARAQRRAPWLLVPMTWVWAMCHGMWPLGVVISLAAVLGLALDRHDTRAPIGKNVLVPVLSLLVGGVLTPVGPALLPAVLTVNSRGSYFAEWAPPNFTYPQNLVVLLVLGLALLVMVRRGHADFFDVCLLTVAGGFAVYSQRTEPVAAVMLVTLTAQQLQRLVGARRRLGRPERLVVWGGAALALAGLAVVVPHTAASPPPQPAWVDAAMEALPPGTTVLDESSFGGYLMWRYPQLDFTFSGYGDIYTDRELEDISVVGDVKPGWDEVVEGSGAEYALVAPDTSLAYALVHQLHWTVVRSSDHIELLDRPPV